ncbi:MAG TPA: hemolysin family protein [Myxococcaceae bacterium]|nr:hemolysin family protein [Myxococcaceae bacterium]
MPTWALWLACLGLTLARALIAAADSALYISSDDALKELGAARPKALRRVTRLKTEREATAASLRFGMVLSGFFAACVAALTPPQMLYLWPSAQSPFLWLGPPFLSVLLIAVFASLVELAARTGVSAHPESWALRLSGLVATLVAVLYPPMRFLVGLLNVLVRPFGARLRFESPPPPLEELEKLLAAQAVAHEVDQGAPQLIRSIFEMSDKRCRDVMVPRTEVVAVDVATPTEEILRVLAEESHSRIPVYRDEIDHIVGVLHSRELIPLLQHPELIVLQDVIRPAHFVPWVKSIGDLLREMQALKIHMAIVVDEYGGFMGVVTLEDILREIVGDISDEFDVEEKLVEKQADGSFIVDAGITVSDFDGVFGLTLPDGDYETLGGFLSSLAGRIPDAGERLGYEGWQFWITGKKGARLTRIRVVRPRALAAADGERAPRADGPKVNVG